MKMTAQEYARRVQKAGPHSPLLADCLWAFCVGGSICLLGEGCAAVLRHGRGRRSGGNPDQLHFDLALGGADHAGLVPEAGGKGRGGVAGAHHRLCQRGGQCSHRVQGRGTGAGTGAKMFLIAGPVIVYGTLAAVVYGAVLWLLGASAL